MSSPLEMLNTITSCTDVCYHRNTHMKSRMEIGGWWREHASVEEEYIFHQMKHLIKSFSPAVACTVAVTGSRANRRISYEHAKPWSNLHTQLGPVRCCLLSEEHSRVVHSGVTRVNKYSWWREICDWAAKTNVATAIYVNLWSVRRKKWWKGGMNEGGWMDVCRLDR